MESSSLLPIGWQMMEKHANGHRMLIDPESGKLPD
jgi:hypothetical protein